MSSAIAVKDPANRALAERIIILALLAGVLFIVLKRALSGIASLWGGGLTDAEQRMVNARTTGVTGTALYDRFDSPGIFADHATKGPHDATVVGEKKALLEHVANEVAKSPGFFNDDEERVFTAIARIPSLYDLMWVNRFFLNDPDVRTLNQFDTPPQIGEYLDAFLQPKDWSRVMSILSKLPKYASA